MVLHEKQTNLVGKDQNQELMFFQVITSNEFLTRCLLDGGPLAEINFTVFEKIQTPLTISLPTEVI